MEKLAMCRICLAENVRMYVVVNRNLHNLYEKLTGIPFVTEDSRPILACFFCCTKLKQCYQLLRQCLKAEELFTQRMNEDYETNPLTNQNHIEFWSRFIKSPVVHMSIVDECQTESIAIKEELPAVCEGLDDFIEPKQELQSDELEPDLDNSCVDVADIPPHQSESDSENYVPLMTFKTEMEEEQELSQKKRTARDTTKLEPDLDNSCVDVADIPTHNSESDSENYVFLMTFKTEMEEEQEVSQEKRTARETTRATVVKKPKLEDAITAEQTKKEKSSTQDIRLTQIGTTNQSQKSSKRNLKHIGIHTDEKPYKCNVCQSCFREKTHLTKHIHIHTGQKPYKCDVCQQSFRVKSRLNQHIRIHTGEKPYNCDVCQRSFSEKGSLTKHIRIHTGEKPYKCDVCQQNFSARSSLAKHILIHTGEKPYKCNICHSNFREKAHLTNHIRIHTGEKPYKCNVCQRSFRERTHLTKHANTH